MRINRSRSQRPRRQPRTK